ncbi:MAG: PTS sugar transporter subunit IIB [Pisciglobus halotolerans]|nr:PTS sugar transporter subunit IIB [Pisciglobus halotolerans]
MAKIVLARIDDRLVHGQVMTQWLQYSGGNHIVIVDSDVAADSFNTNMMKMAVPRSVKLDVFTEEEGAEKINELPDSAKVIILAKRPQVFDKLIEDGLEITSVIVGGMGQNQERKKLYKNIAASDEEREAFRRIIDKGTGLKIRVVPSDKETPVETLL